MIFYADELQAAQPGFNAAKSFLFVQRADVVYPSTDEPRKVKPGWTRCHDVDGLGFRFLTPDGYILKGQTRPADVLKFADDFGLAAENLDSVVPDVTPSVLSSFISQKDLHHFQQYQHSNSQKPEDEGDERC